MIIQFLFQGHHHHHHCRQVHLPLTEFAAFFRGQQVEDAPQLDLTKVTKFLFMAVIESICFHKHIFYSQIGAFGLQTFGGVYDNFKQSGAGALEIDSISLYWAFAFNKPFCKFEWNNCVPNTLNDTPLLFTSAFKMLYNVCMFCVLILFPRDFMHEVLQHDTCVQKQDKKLVPNVKAQTDILSTHTLRMSFTKASAPKSQYFKNATEHQLAG